MERQPQIHSVFTPTRLQLKVDRELCVLTDFSADVLSREPNMRCENNGCSLLKKICKFELGMKLKS
jgi:hypothetical protein